MPSMHSSPSDLRLSNHAQQQEASIESSSNFVDEGLFLAKPTFVVVAGHREWP